MIGRFHIIVGGFTAGYTAVTTQTYALDTSIPDATWQRMDDYPFPAGVTHAASVVVGSKLYMCGGYAGGGIGMQTDICMAYDHSKPKGLGQQWSIFAPLPNGGRAGGAMVYSTALNSLIYSAGATRPVPQQRSALDHNTTWIYSLKSPSAGWIARAPMPFHANHMSFVTARDVTGKERHYFTGGQKEEDEHDGNVVEHFEYDAIKDVWIKRKAMTIPRSHAASSTRAFGCGFIMVAGCTNGGQRISDISYYDTSTDTWTKIGDLTDPINTPVCGINNGMLYCDTGWDSGQFSKKIAIAF
jgi:N-acetylneuraminic acid mutarotase